MSREIIIGNPENEEAVSNNKGLEKILELRKNVEVIDPNNNLLKAASLINDDAIGIFATNHGSPADTIAVYVALNEIQSKVDPKHSKGIRFIYAKSIDTGHQGKLVQRFFAGFKEVLKKVKIFPLSVVRKKDQEEYGLIPDMDSLKEILDIPNTGLSVFLYPEGTLEGGRKGKDGKQKGLQLAEEAKSVNKVCKKCVKQGKNFFALPMTIIGSNLVLNPDIKDPSAESINYDQKFQIIIGDILYGKDLIDQKEEPVDIIMRHIGFKLPEELRGVYR
ncbi:MAG: hypothetical protein WDA13_03710 [Candidatus Shapirobacteria bacterium]